MRDDFSELEPPEWLFEAIPPDPDGLYDFLRALLTDEMIEEIARSDYDMEVEEHRAALVELRDGVPSSAKLSWNPNEVLELSSWGDGTGGRKSQLTTAFCCSVLLRNEDKHGNRVTHDYRRLGPLILSLDVLGEEFREKLLGVIAHGLSVMKPWEDEYLHFAWAICHVLSKEPSPLTVVQVQEVCAWYIRIWPEVKAWHAKTYLWDAPPQRPTDYSHKVMWTRRFTEPPQGILKETFPGIWDVVWKHKKQDGD